MTNALFGTLPASQSAAAWGDREMGSCHLKVKRGGTDLIAAHAIAMCLGAPAGLGLYDEFERKWISEMTSTRPTLASASLTHQDQFYGGKWHQTRDGRITNSLSPADGSVVGPFTYGSAADVDLAVAAAQSGFANWSRVAPLERAKIMREVSAIIRAHSAELAYLDAADGGNPVAEMTRDVLNAANQWEFFSGLVTELKGASIPMGPDAVNFSVREPMGVIARIVAFNHPFMFTAAKAAAPVAAGNSVIDLLVGGR